MLNAREGHQTGAETGRRKRSGVTTREEAVVEEGGTQKGPRREGRGAMREGADLPGVIGSIKTEKGKTKGADVVTNEPLDSDISLLNSAK